MKKIALSKNFSPLVKLFRQINFAVIVCAITAMCFASCKITVNNPVTPATDKNFAYMSLMCNASSLGNFENQSRATFFPSGAQTIEELSNFVLKGTLSGQAESTIKSWEKYSDITTTANIPIKPGVWDFTLTADYDGKTCYGARLLSQTLTAGETYNLTFNIVQLSYGEGSVSLQINWQAAKNQVVLVKAGLFDYDGNAISNFELEKIDFAKDSSDSSKLCAEYKKDNVPSGSYVVKFYLYRDSAGADLINVFSYGVQIGASLFSKGVDSITLLNYKWKLTLNPNGGTFTGTVKDTLSFTEYESVYITLPTSSEISREGYDFLGWSKDGSDEIISKWSMEKMTQDVTISAKWERQVPYKVRHLLQKISADKDAAQGEAASDVDEVISGGKTYYKYYTENRTETFYAHAQEMTNAQFAASDLISNIGNYKVIGTSDNAGNTEPKITQKVIAADGTTVVDIFYDVKPIYVTLEPNGGTGTSKRQIFYSETNCIKLEPLADLKFTKDHHNFTGWNEKIDGSGNNYADGEALAFKSVPADDITLYAQWLEIGKAVYTMRYLLQKISVVKPAETDSEIEVEEFVSGGKKYYKYYEAVKTLTNSDYPGETTQADFATEAMIPNIKNYREVGTSDNIGSSVPAITQKVIAADGTTVVDIYYDVKPIYVTLEPNGGTGTTTKQTFYTETSCIGLESIADLGFAKKYYSFTGWNTEPDGSGTSCVDKAIISFTNEETLTLYAQWKFSTFGNVDTDIIPSGAYNLTLYADSTILSSYGTVNAGQKISFKVSGDVSVPSGAEYKIAVKHNGVEIPSLSVTSSNLGEAIVTIPQNLVDVKATVDVYVSVKITVNGKTYIFDETVRDVRCGQ